MNAASEACSLCALRDCSNEKFGVIQKQKKND